MTFKSTLAKILGVPLVLFGLGGAQPVLAQDGNNLRVKAYRASENSNEASFLKVKSPYSLWKKLKGFTFMQFHDGKYIGKSSLSVSVSDSSDFDWKVQLFHKKTPLNGALAGVQYNFPFEGKKVGADVYVSPLGVDDKGDLKRDLNLQYSFKFPLPLGIQMSGFGELCPLRNEWKYGEIGIAKKIINSKFDVDLSAGYLLHGRKEKSLRPNSNFKVGLEVSTEI